MEDEHDDLSAPENEQKGLDRILALSDGVFAFAITLLVLGLTVPALSKGESRTSLNLFKSLSGDLGAFYSYAMSFFVISIWWTAHHRIFRDILRYDRTLMWRNLFFLLFITIIPFLTQLLNEYGDIRIAVIIYDLVQAFGGLALSSVWSHASQHHLLISKSLTRAQIRNASLRSYVPSIGFVVAIILTFVIPSGISPSIANFAIFLIYPLNRIVFRKTDSAA